jgi:hypothetical protein
MLMRIALGAITLFWLVMNVLLWRSEFKTAGGLGSSVQVSTVWQKVLTAPDDSSLEIWREGKRIGRCRWSANVGEELATGKVGAEDQGPEGQIKQLSGYTIDITDGLVDLDEQPTRLRFSVHLQFSTNHTWREFSARASIRPSLWEIRASAADEKVTAKIEDDTGQWERTYTFSDLRNPQMLMRDFGAPGLVGLLGGPGILLPNPKSISLGLQWDARNDWLNIGHSKVRAYRLEAKIMDRYRAVMILSRVGEIMRVELPDNIVMINEALNF